MDLYPDIKALIMKCIAKYLNMKNFKEITRDMAGCLSLLILAGVFYHWPNCIKELIQECMNGNLTLCYLVLRSLADIDI